MAPLALEDLQALVLYAYKGLPRSRYLFLRVVDPPRARRWLGRALAEVPDARPARTPARAVHLAFGWPGLVRLGLPEAAAATFPREFRQGMAHEERARALGDRGQAAPERWQFGGPEAAPLDLLLMLFATDDGALGALDGRHRRELEAGGLALVHAEDGYVAPEGREHFGFRDGLSQPAIAGVARRPEAGDEAGAAGEAVAPGEFVLGYKNEYGALPLSPSVAPDEDRAGLLPALPGGRRDLGRNGTYLVFRKLAQDVGAFRTYLRHATARPDGAPDPGAAALLAARMVGRWPGGAPLVASGRDDPALANANAFSFADDRRGLRCPLGAHVRRCNPRDGLAPGPAASARASRRHRLVRRGRPYGPPLPPDCPDDGVDRGLLFVVLNANLRRQFEFIQQTWVNNPKFDGLSDEDDPLAGARLGGQAHFTVPRDPLRERHHALPRFVWPRGGGYFFLPGLRALRYLAEGLG
ncbi:MAG TPA: Dyp-type peroxidase [Polyangiaceae bacterium]|nr:Dyp-type peroxidase [Polyangiaceae bacterium]